MNVTELLLEKTTLFLIELACGEGAMASPASTTCKEKQAVAVVTNISNNIFPTTIIELGVLAILQYPVEYAIDLAYRALSR